MFRIILGLAMVVIIAGPAWGQSRQENGEPPPVKRPFSSAAGFCSGDVKGKRYRIFGNQITLRGTLRIDDNYRVRDETLPQTMFTSQFFDPTPTVGGSVELYDPLYDPSQPNRCFMGGVIRLQDPKTLKKHKIVLSEIWLPKGGGSLEGDGFVNGVYTTLTLAPY